MKEVRGGLEVGIRARFIAFANLKGGTGKTTIAAWLSCALASAGRKVAMIDLDPQAHLTNVWLSASDLTRLGNRIIPNVWTYIYGEGGEGLFKDFKISNLKRELKGKGVDLLLVPSDLDEYVACWSQSRNPDPKKAEKFRWETGLKDYDYVIIDCPPDPGYARLGIYIADHVIIPTDASDMSLRGTELFIIKILSEIMSVHRDLHLLGIIMNRVSRGIRKEARKRIDEIVKKLLNETQKPEKIEIRKRIHDPILFNTTIPQRVELGKVAEGKGVRALRAFSRVRRGEEGKIVEKFRELAKEVESRIAFFKGFT